jgi:hypothetical protein
MESGRAPIVTTTVGSYAVQSTVGGLPYAHDSIVSRAALAETFDLDREAAEGWEPFFVSVARNDDSPRLTVTQRFFPAGYGFYPAILIVPETARLFIGAGTRVLIYDLESPRRLSTDTADTGFWGWALHGNVVVMSAELELAAWRATGEKLWTGFVEPPWTYKVFGTIVELDVMGKITRFPLETGPEKL